VEFVTQIFGFGDHLSKSTALGGVNALVQCKEGQVFAVRTVTLVREGFSTNFSTFLLKSFDRGGVVNRREVRMREYERLEKRKNFPFALCGRCLALNHFRGAFFDAAAVRMLE
jgi:hypothetical protein